MNARALLCCFVLDARYDYFGTVDLVIHRSVDTKHVFGNDTPKHIVAISKKVLRIK